jgi:hypothetical protein
MSALSDLSLSLRKKGKFTDARLLYMVGLLKANHSLIYVLCSIPQNTSSSKVLERAIKSNELQYNCYKDLFVENCKPKDTHALKQIEAYFAEQLIEYQQGLVRLRQ